jgi:hypothetical protein
MLNGPRPSGSLPTQLIGRSTVFGVSAPSWESLGEPEWKVEEWKQWGFEPDHVLHWREKLKKAIAEHNTALRKMLAGEWPGVSRSDAARAVTSARRAASESADPVPFGVAVIGRGTYPYPRRERRYLDEREWDEFLVVVAERDYGVVVGAALPRDLVERLESGEAERRLSALFVGRVRKFFDARTEPDSPIFDVVMHLGPIPFDPERSG